MPTQDPTPDADHRGSQDDVAEPGQVGRKPPAPGAVPLSNLPPPGFGLEVDEVVVEAADAAPDVNGPGVDDVDSHEVDVDELAALLDGRPPEPDPDLDPDPHLAPDRDRDPDLAPDREVASDREVEVEVEAEVEAEVEPEADLEVVPDPDAPPELDAPADDGQLADERVAATPKRSGRSRRTAVLLLLVVLAAAFGVVKHREADDLAAVRDDRRAVERVSSAFGAAYLSYDFAHADESARAVHHLATDAFAEAYAAQSAPGIQELFSSRQTTTAAETQEVFVGAVRRASARALVVVDVTATSATDGVQTLDDVSFVLDLARTDAGWRVSKVARAPQPALHAPPPIAASPTSAP